MSMVLRDIQGNRVSLCDFAGKVVLLVFWGACCQTSRDSLLGLQEVWDRHRADGFELVSINKDPADTESVVRQTVHRYGYRFPVLLDQESEACNRFNPTMVFPFHVLLNRQGRVEMMHEGYKLGDESLIEERIRRMIR